MELKLFFNLLLLCCETSVGIEEIEERNGVMQKPGAKEEGSVRRIFIGMVEVPWLGCGPVPETLLIALFKINKIYFLINETLLKRHSFKSHLHLQEEIESPGFVLYCCTSVLAPFNLFSSPGSLALWSKN